MITIDALQLPDGLFWTDEFSGSRVSISDQYSLLGRLFMHRQIKHKGRRITLEGTKNRGVILRDSFLELKELSNKGGIHSLKLHNGDVYRVMFVYPDAISAVLMKQQQDPKPDDKYHSLVVRLMEV